MKSPPTAATSLTECDVDPYEIDAATTVAIPATETGATIARTLEGTRVGALTAPTRPPQAVGQGQVRNAWGCGRP